MKDRLHHRFHSKSSAHSAKQGSALLLTLLVVSLLLVIVLAFTVYVRIELRIIGERIALEQARNNARVGLEIAISNLQMNGGIDQAVTANAELMTDVGNFKDKWTGVWRNDAPGFDPRSSPPAFATWLVSGAERLSDPAALQAMVGDFGIDTGPGGAPVTNDRQVVMLGDGGGNIAVADQVAVPRVTNVINGADHSYAYWVADQSVKALVPLPEEDEAAIDNARALARSASPARPRIEDVGQLGNALNLLDPGTRDKLPRLTRHSEAGLLSAPTGIAAEENFHDLTYHSLGLFTNPVEGGLKKDFSTAFEISEVSFRNSEFAHITGSFPDEWVTTNWNNATPQTKPIFNFFTPDSRGAVNNPVYRGPTFDLIRDHYRLYQEVSSPFSKPTLAARGYFPNAYSGTNDSDRKPYRYVTAPELISGSMESRGPEGDPSITDTVSGRPVGTNRPRPRFTKTEVAPEIVRFLNMYSVALFDERPTTLVHDPAGNYPENVPPEPGQTEGNITLIMEPILYLHNPYNVALEFDAMRLMYFRFDFGLNGFLMEDGTWWPYDHDQRIFPMSGEPTISGYTIKEMRALGATDINQVNTFNLDIIVTKDGLPISTPVRLEPGETRAFTANNASPESIGTNFRVVLTEAVTDNVFSGGVTLSYLHQNNPWTSTPRKTVMQSTQRFMVAFDFRGSGSYVSRGWAPGNDIDWEYNYMTTYLLDRSDISHENDKIAESTDSPGLRHFRLWPSAFLSGHNGEMNYSLIPYNRISGTNTDPEKYYIGFTDFYMKPSQGEHYQTELLTHHATRAIALDPPASGGVGKNGRRIAKTWGLSMANESEVKTGVAPDGRFSFGADGRGKWGSSLRQDEGQERVVLYDVPTKPLTSIGELQHLNQAIQFWEPSYAVGNSLASPYLPRDQLWNFSTAGEFERSQFDVSYLSNEALWDRYFFSSLSRPATGTGYDLSPSLTDTLETWEQDPLNPRVIPLGTSSLALRQTELAESKYTSSQTNHDADVPHNRMAEFYGLAGAFNVNSVSVDAWKAVLGSLQAGELLITDDAGEVETLALDDLLRYFPRTALQADGFGTTPEERWAGVANLTEAQLTELAENIVAEIKARARAQGGPFPSLTRFVNRQLDNSDFGLSGPLQAAIDQTGVNTAVLDSEGDDIKLNSSDDITTIYRWRESGPTALRNKTAVPGTPETDTNFIGYPSPEHFRHNSAAGIAQYVSQADVLQVIGSQLASRGDTFVIRAFGGFGDDPHSGMWCEAVVQRRPDYVDPADPAYRHPDNVTSANRVFGRRFEVISFRWLSKEEI